MADTLRSARPGEVHRPHHGARAGDHRPRGLLIGLGGVVSPGEGDAVLPVDRIAALVTGAVDGSVRTGQRGIRYYRPLRFGVAADVPDDVAADLGPRRLPHVARSTP